MTSRVQARVDVAAPPEEVFAFFDDLAHAPILVPRLVEVTRVEALANGGRRVEYVTLGRDESRVEASTEHLVYEPPTRTVSRTVQSGIESVSTREFVAVDGATRVLASIEWDAPVRYVSRLVAAPLRGPYRRALRDALDGARAALEAR